MKQDSNGKTETQYEFPPGLPVSDAASGTSLLVSGPSGGGVHEVALDLLASAGKHQGLLLLSADISARGLLDRLDASPWPITRSMVGIVDCTGDSDVEERFTTHGRPIDGPGDLTGIEVEFSLLYEKLMEREPTGVRIGVLSLTPLLTRVPQREASRFVHLLTGRIIATGDLGVLVVDSSRIAEEVIETLSHFCDRHIEVRPDDSQVEIRVTEDSGWSTWSSVGYEISYGEWPGEHR